MNFNLDYGTSNSFKTSIVLLISIMLFAGMGAAEEFTVYDSANEADSDLEFASIQAAVEEANTNDEEDTITIADDITVDSRVDVDSDITFTGDSVVSTAGNMLEVFETTSDASFENLHLKVTEGTENSPEIIYVEDGETTVESVTFTRKDGDSNAAVRVDSASAVVEDSTFNNVKIGAELEADDSLEVSGSDFESVPSNEAVWVAGSGYSSVPREATVDVEGEGLVRTVRSDDVTSFYTTIQSAVDNAAEDATVKVASGNYDESVTIDTPEVTLEGAYPETEGSSDDRGDSEAVVDGRIKVVADGVTVTGLTVDGTDERAVAVGEAEGVTVSNNIIQDSKRGVQGDYSGRPTDLTVKNNLISTEYGIASTEDIDTLTVEENIFQTSEEGIGLGEGAVLADDEGISGMFDDNTWNLEDGYAVKEYRQDGDVYVAEGGSIQSAIEVAGVKNSDNVYVTEESTLVKAGQGTYDEQIEISDKALTVEGNGESSTTITDTVTVDPGSDSDVTISSVKISTSGDGVNSIVQETGDLTVEESSLEVDADTPGAGYTPVIEVNNNDGVTEVIDSVISGSSQESEAEFGMWVGASSEGVTVNDVNFTDLRIGIESRTDIAVFDSNFNSFDTVGAQAIRVAEGNADEVGKVNVSSNTFSVNPGLGDDTEEEFDGAPTAAIRFSDQTDSDNKINGPVTVVGNEFADMSDGVAVSVGQEASIQSDIDARHNYWGQASGPTDSQIEGEVDFRPWLLEPEGERYDDTFSIAAEEWALVSPTKPVTGEPEVVGDSEGIEGTAMTYEDGEWSDVSDPSLEPLSSYYFRTSDSAGIGVNYEEASNPERVYNKQLQEGWNLIGSAVNTNKASTAFSTIQAVEQDGAMSVFVPTQANSQKRLSAVETWGEGGMFNAVPMSRLDFIQIEEEEERVVEFDREETAIVTTRDGYWVYMSGEDEYSQAVEEGNNDLKRLEDYIPLALI